LNIHLRKAGWFVSLVRSTFLHSEVDWIFQSHDFHWSDKDSFIMLLQADDENYESDENFRKYKLSCGFYFLLQSMFECLWSIKWNGYHVTAIFFFLTKKINLSLSAWFRMSLFQFQAQLKLPLFEVFCANDTLFERKIVKVLKYCDPWGLWA